MTDKSTSAFLRACKRVLIAGIALGAAGVYVNTLYAADPAANVAASETPSNEVQASATPAAQSQVLTVHKSPTCGCCGDWVDHMEEAGFDTQVVSTQDLNSVKQKHGIDPRLQSCHTSVSADGAYFFEGHIPAKLVKQFLAEKPEGAAGLAVPGMPLGSPGMDYDDRFQAYDVVQVNKDGSLERYARINSAAEQH